MTKITASEILRQDAILKSAIIDWDSPLVKEWMERTRFQQRTILKHKQVSEETLRQRITI